MLRLYELIRARGYTMREISEKIGVTEEYLTRSISGEPSVEIMEKIARILDVKVENFLNTNHDEEELYGIVIYKKKTYKITSRQNLDKLYEDVNKGFYQVKSYF